MHRRLHVGTAKLRALYHTTADAPNILTSAPAQVSCTHCAAAGISKTSHSGHLDAPTPLPGTRIHVDVKGEMIDSVGGFRYSVFFIDEASRHVWVEFMTNKSEVVSATKGFIARFNAEVGVPTDDNGKPLARPSILEFRRDHEGGTNRMHSEPSVRRMPFTKRAALCMITI